MPGDKSNRKGPPPYVKKVYRGLRRSNPDWTESHAYAVAWNVAKRMCATGDLNYPGLQKVNAASRAEACAAVATLKHPDANGPIRG